MTAKHFKNEIHKINNQGFLCYSYQKFCMRRKILEIFFSFTTMCLSRLVQFKINICKFVLKYKFFVKTFSLWAVLSILWNASVFTMQSLMESNNKVRTYVRDAASSKKMGGPQ